MNTPCICCWCRKPVLYFRPHCGGNPYSRIPPQSFNLGGMIEYFSPGRRMFNCSCPDGLSGDQCESCNPVEGRPRYQKSSGVCADCDCSSLSASPVCDFQTGQCPCQSEGQGPQISKAGRRCVSILKSHWDSRGWMVLSDGVLHSYSSGT